MKSHEDKDVTIYKGDSFSVLDNIQAKSVNCVVTSPPYWKHRDYDHSDQIGLEESPETYVSKLVRLFRLIKNVLKDDGTVWLNLGDTYQDKSLVGIPWLVAFALKYDGWYLRSDIIWHKSNPKPSGVKDRPTTAHEYLFLLSLSEKYYYDHKAVMEKATGRDPGNKTHKYAKTEQRIVNIGPKEFRNKRDVWTIGSQTYRGAHFAIFPEKLVEPCILAGSPAGGLVLDPFLGSGTTLLVARRLGRRGVGIEINEEYIEQAKERLGV